MAKKAEKKEPITLQQVAEELNDIMAYGQNEKGEVVRPKELIDVKMKEKPLLEEILKRAAADLRASDEEEFSEDAWNFFLDNGITPSEDDVDPVDAGDDEGSEGSDDSDADDTDTDEEAEEAPVKTKGKAKAESKPAGKGKEKAASEDGEKKGIKKAMVPGGNEAKAVELAKEGLDLNGFIKEFTKIYNASGQKDETYIHSRAKIYFNIGYKKIGKTAPGTAAKTEAPKGKPKAAAKEEAEAPAETSRPRGRGRR